MLCMCINIVYVYSYVHSAAVVVSKDCLPLNLDINDGVIIGIELFWNVTDY